LVDFGLQDLKSSFVVSVSPISADLFFGGGVAARSLISSVLLAEHNNLGDSLFWLRHQICCVSSFLQLKEHALDLVFLLGFLTTPVNIGGSCPTLIPLPIFVFVSCADSFCHDFSAPRSQARAASRFSHTKSAQARAWVQ
jgi:hypothetical protein